MQIDLTGKTAFVTGGNIGIGRAVSLALARCGADVALTCYSHKAEAEETVKAVEDIGHDFMGIAAAGLTGLNMNSGGPDGRFPRRQVSPLLHRRQPQLSRLLLAEPGRLEEGAQGVSAGRKQRLGARRLSGPARRPLLPLLHRQPASRRGSR